MLGIVGCRRESLTIEAENLVGVDSDVNYGVAASRGWAAYGQRSFSGGRAALTRIPGATMSGHLDHFRKGSYRVEVIVLNYAGPARNIFDLTVGGVTKRLHFGGGDSLDGLTRLGGLYFANVRDDSITVRAESVGQQYLVIDCIRLRPVASIATAQSPWEGNVIADAHAPECVNCLEAESLQPVSHDPNYGAAARSGWASYAETSYSAGRAALTSLPGAVMTGHIPNFRPGPYRVTVTVLVQGNERNTFELQLGNETRRISFGGAGFSPGVTRLKNVRFNHVDGNDVAIKAVEIDQPYLIIDALSFQPLASTAAEEERSTFTVSVPIVETCMNCVEAESLQGVAAIDRDYGTAARAGWASYEEASYSKNRAALTKRIGATMIGNIPNFRPGGYRVTITLLNYDSPKTNSFDLSLGSRTKRITIGPKLRPGVIRIRDIIFPNVNSPVLKVTAVEIEQPYLVIDTISLQPLPPAGKANRR
jgi:hypothetical protein